MSSIFYPILPFSCPWGACRFCGIPFMAKVLTSEMPAEQELIAQFNAFVRDPKNQADIRRHRRVVVATNGSIVPEVPKIQRDHILRFCREHGLRFESELNATLIDPKKARALYDRTYRAKFPALTAAARQEKVHATLAEIDQALNQDFPRKGVRLNTGLEVADANDLKRLNKYTTDLNDYVAYAEYLRQRKISVGANILIGAPMIADSVGKALLTIRFAFEKMRVDKVLLTTWTPVLHTVAKKMYDRGEVDVLSATESAAIYQAARAAYPDKEIEYNPMRAYVWHGKHGKFKDSRINTDDKKEIARESVQRKAQDIFR